MACSTCGQIRNDLRIAVSRGQISTATRLAAKGAKHMAKRLAAPAVTAAIRKR